MCQLYFPFIFLIIFILPSLIHIDFIFYILTEAQFQQQWVRAAKDPASHILWLTSPLIQSSLATLFENDETWSISALHGLSFLLWTVLLTTKVPSHSPAPEVISLISEAYSKDLIQPTEMAILLNK